MGNSLHNKIYLGRHGWLGSRRIQGVLALAAGISVAVAWFTLRNWR